MNSFPSRSAAKHTKTLLPSSVCANKQKARETRAACFTASRQHVQEGSNPSTALYINLCKWELLWLAKASRPPDGVTHRVSQGRRHQPLQDIEQKHSCLHHPEMLQQQVASLYQKKHQIWPSSKLSNNPSACTDPCLDQSLVNDYFW